MRVVVSYAAAAGDCSGNTYGEVEDYAVKFIDLQPCSTTTPVPTVSNMTSSTAYVSWIFTANATYRIRWRQGTTGVWQLQPLGYVELVAGQSYYSITGLLEQTAYQVQIHAKCGTSWGAYKIYSASGRLVSSGLIVNNAIDVSSLINGLYIIDIEDVKGSVKKKFIKE